MNWELYRYGETQLAWVSHPDERVMKEYSSLRDARSRSVTEEQIERAARKIAAQKCGLVLDPDGERLPGDIWRQAIPQVHAVIAALGMR